MIIGVGTDIVCIKRVNPQNAAKILSKQELERYEHFTSPTRKQEFLAGRWAAKEALTKACTASMGTYDFNAITITQDETGKPLIETPLIPGHQIMLSLSHEREYAIAIVIIETKNEP